MEERRYRSRDGLSLFYREWQNDAPTVLCLPGLTRNSRDFIDLAEHLAPRFRVICPDLRGRGHSDRDPNWRQYHPGTYADDLWQLMDVLDLQEAAIIGTSLGGILAMLMATQQPDRLTGVVLNDVGPKLEAEGIGRILTYVGRHPPVKSWDEAACQIRNTYLMALPGMPEAFWAGYARQGYRENADGIPELDMDPNIGDAVRLPDAFTFDAWAGFRALPSPCLLLRGEHSDVLGVETVGAMQTARPDLSSVTVPERGHAPLLDEPESRAAIGEWSNVLTHCSS